MVTAKFSDDFKRDPVAQITERGYPIAKVSRRLGVSQHSPSHLQAARQRSGRVLRSVVS